ncbi:MAG: glycosyltransferase family 4 protein [Christensenellaceae bacterium]|nr:glycosyltransferase family 4 protein [Christensenellaceae bacterium]
MKLLLVDNAHLFKDVSGCYYTPSIYNDDFFQRYLSVFDSVRFVAKVRKVNEVDCQKMLKITDSRVEILELPWFRGFSGLIKTFPKLFGIFRNCAQGCDCAIFRIAQVESILAFLLMKRRSIQIAAEVVNDPGAFSNIGVFVRMLLVYLHKRIIRSSVGVSYVTKWYLQQKYPCNAIKFRGNPDYFTSEYSSISLLESDITAPRSRFSNDRIVLVHSANHFVDDSKGHKVVIDVLYNLRSKGLPIYVKFIGDGLARAQFEEYAKEKEVSVYIKFVGKISNHVTYMNEMRSADICIFPSMSEGLPRVVIEALANGLPTVASRVGGTVELIEDKWLFEPSDVEGFSNAIERIVKDETIYAELSRKGIIMAREFVEPVLKERRTAFYNELMKRSIK